MAEPRPHPELIPRAVRQALIDAVGGWGLYTVAEIADLFSDEGFSRTSETTAFAGGARRQEAEVYQADINYSDPDQVERYLHVLEKVLDDHADAKDDDTRKRYERLAKALKRADIAADERGHLRLPAHRALGVPSLAAVPTESGIRLQLDRLGRLDQEPEEMIGAAKELVEATAKHVLLELGEELPENADLPGLSKLALAKLRLHPKAIAPTTKGSEVMAKILSSLGQTAGGLAELRNLGYGTGHGAGLRVKGLGHRHAEFAARAAIAYTTFVLDTLNDPDAPWRSAGDT
jgi:hypothetical protein